MDEILLGVKGRNGTVVFEWAQGVDSPLLSIWLSVDGHETRSVVFGPEQVGNVAAVACEILTAAGGDDSRHVIELRADGWILKHPLSCRPRLFDCALNRAAELSLLGGHDVGRYEVTLGGEDGSRLIIGERVADG